LTTPRITKADIIAQMNKTDSEIHLLDNELALTLKEKDYYLSLFPVIPDPPPSSHLTLIEPFSPSISPLTNQIFTEANHQRLIIQKELSSIYDGVPHSLYNEPVDLPFFHDNIRSFEAFKPVLRGVLARRRQTLLVKTVQLQQDYAEKWAHWREYSKQAEEKHKAGVLELQISENISNVRRSRSRRKLPEFLEEKRDTNTRFLDSLADIPALILDVQQRKIHFKDHNGIIPDSQSLDFMKRRENIWLPDEEKTFVELFRKYHKNFEQISSLLPYKSTKDCIKFYYVNKKRLFKEEKPKPRKRTTRDPSCKIMNSRVMSKQYKYKNNNNFVETNSSNHH